MTFKGEPYFYTYKKGELNYMKQMCLLLEITKKYNLKKNDNLYDNFLTNIKIMM